MMLHAAHGNQQGHERIVIRTTHTDVVVISQALFMKKCIQQLWIPLGTGKDFRYIAIHEMGSSFSPQRKSSFLFFYALSRCDTRSLEIMERNLHGKHGRSFFPRQRMHLLICGLNQQEKYHINSCKL